MARGRCGSPGENNGQTGIFRCSMLARKEWDGRVWQSGNIYAWRQQCGQVWGGGGGGQGSTSCMKRCASASENRVSIIAKSGSSKLNRICNARPHAPLFMLPKHQPTRMC